MGHIQEHNQVSEDCMQERYQNNIATSHNRYPKIFALCKKYYMEKLSDTKSGHNRRLTVITEEKEVINDIFKIVGGPITEKEELFIYEDAKKVKSGVTDCMQERYQNNIATSHNRHPKIFALCKKYYMEELSDRRPNILSFGCATGEECLTLAEYFPSATILGVDTDKGLLEKCNKKNIYSNVSFAISNSENIKKNGPFDIVFCMSVLCRWGSDKVLSFPKFQRIIGELDKILAKCGLLVIYNSSFRFSDSSIYHKYKVLHDPEIDSGYVTMFDKGYNKVSRRLYKDSIFIKMME